MSLGELTTTFTPPTPCVTSFSNVYSVTSNPNSWLQQGPLTTNSCFPSNYRDQYSNYYSPGTCPSGYATACSSLSYNDNMLETIATCCPLGYECNNVDSPQAYEATLGCISPFAVLTPASVTLVDMDRAITSIATNMSIGGAYNAFSIQVRNQAETSQSTSSFPTSLPTSPTSSASITTPASSDPLATSSPSDSSSGVSSGAVAGISVGSAMGGILLVAAIVVAFCIGRSRGRGEKVSHSCGVDAEYPAGVDQQLHFLDRGAGLTSGPVNELELSGVTSGQVNELDISGATNELDSNHRTADRYPQ